MAVFTLCFCGTDCWPDESLVDRPGSARASFAPCGYIPVTIHRDIQAGPEQGKAVIPGPGAPWDRFRKELWVPQTVLAKQALLDTANGHSMWDLAGHAAATAVGVPSLGREKQRAYGGDQATFALIGELIRLGFDLNPADADRRNRSKWCYQFSPSMMRMLRLVHALRDGGGSVIDTVNIIGHSRGAVVGIMAAWELQYLLPRATVNIFAIDPVPGAGALDDEMAKLPSNVASYVGVYALDEVSSCFNGVVPQPIVGDKHIDPLAGTAPDKRIAGVEAGHAMAAAWAQNTGYRLVYAPGRHSTVSGNQAIDGDKGIAEPDMAAVGTLVDRLARHYLAAWGTALPAYNDLRGQIETARLRVQAGHAAAPDQSRYRLLRKHTYKLMSPSPMSWRERGVTSSSGYNPSAWRYLEDAIGIQPLIPRESKVKFISDKLTSSKPGYVRWTQLGDCFIPAAQAAAAAAPAAAAAAPARAAAPPVRVVSAEQDHKYAPTGR